MYFSACLSWDLYLRVILPPFAQPSICPLPARRNVPSVRRLPRHLIVFRPCVFSTLRRFTPNTSRKFISPCYRTRGSLRFHRPPPQNTLSRDTDFPATRFIPLEESPLPAAVPHHCGRYLLVVTLHITTKHLPKQTLLTASF
jgi:hypothetical protein